MTTDHTAPSRPGPRERLRYRLGLLLAAAGAVPALTLRSAGIHAPNPVEALLFGLAIVGAAFLLSWAAEVAQLDISAGLAIAVLALIAVLPEYAVDFVFTWQGGRSVRLLGPSCPPLEAGTASPCSLALANMTGANRLLIGVGWALVVFIAWWRWRSLRRGRGRSPLTEAGRKVAAAPWRGVVLERSHAVELAFLAAATAWSLTIPFRHSISLVDTLVLVGIFAMYAARISRAPAEEPHLVGPARLIGAMPTHRRRSVMVAMFAFAGVVILLCAEPFAHALVETGKDYGINEFFLVQWLAPLASEAPEFIVAILFAWRLHTGAALGALVSSKVNQWTLLVGTLPIVFAISSRSLHGLPIQGAQRQELFLTAAQSVFAVAMLTNLRMSLGEAAVVFGLFWAQFLTSAFAPPSVHGHVLIGFGLVYIVLGAALLVRHHRQARTMLRDGFSTSYAELAVAGDEG